jgi:hypothetical protein
MSLESKENRRAMRDRFAIAAMQSLIQNYAIMDKEGLSKSTDPDTGEEFRSIAAEATENGWRRKDEDGLSLGMFLACDAYSIARCMMDERDEHNWMEDEEEELEQKTDTENSKEATEEPESAANQSGRGNDGSRVLEVPAVEPAAGESQVGSDQQACSERLQESQPER